MDGAAAKVWSDADSPAVCLLTLGVDRYGAGAINWTPQTWVQEIQDDTGVALPPRGLDRLSAACVLLVHPHEFYRSPATFTDVIQGLAAEWFDTHTWHPPTAHECAWGLVEAHLIHPPENGEKFSPEIVRYVHMLTRNDGFPNLPGVFRTFGIGDDAELPPPHDYSGDPDTAAVVAGGVDGREKDLSEWVATKLHDLASRLIDLPLKNTKNVAAVAQTLRQAATTA